MDHGVICRQKVGEILFFVFGINGVFFVPVIITIIMPQQKQRELPPPMKAMVRNALEY